MWTTAPLPAGYSKLSYKPAVKHRTPIFCNPIFVSLFSSVLVICYLGHVKHPYTVMMLMMPKYQFIEGPTATVTHAAAPDDGKFGH